MGNHGPRVPAPLPSPIRPRPSCCITVLNRRMTMMNPALLRQRLPLLMTLLGPWGQPQFVHNPLPKHVIWFWFLFCATQLLSHFYLFRGYMWSWEETSLWNWAGVYFFRSLYLHPRHCDTKQSPPPHPTPQGDSRGERNVALFFALISCATDTCIHENCISYTVWLPQ